MECNKKDYMDSTDMASGSDPAKLPGAKCLANTAATTASASYGNNIPTQQCIKDEPKLSALLPIKKRRLREYVVVDKDQYTEGQQAWKKLKLTQLKRQVAVSWNYGVGTAARKLAQENGDWSMVVATMPAVSGPFFYDERYGMLPSPTSAFIGSENGVSKHDQPVQFSISNDARSKLGNGSTEIGECSIHRAKSEPDIDHELEVAALTATRNDMMGSSSIDTKAPAVSPSPYPYLGFLGDSQPNPRFHHFQMYDEINKDGNDFLRQTVTLNHFKPVADTFIPAPSSRENFRSCHDQSISVKGITQGSTEQGPKAPVLCRCLKSQPAHSGRAEIKVSAPWKRTIIDLSPRWSLIDDQQSLLPGKPPKLYSPLRSKSKSAFVPGKLFH